MQGIKFKIAECHLHEFMLSDENLFKLMKSLEVLIMEIFAKFSEMWRMKDRSIRTNNGRRRRQRLAPSRNDLCRTL